MMPDLAQEQAVAVAALRAVAALCRALRTEWGAQPQHKADDSPVTLADLGGQALVGRALALAFADDPLVGEEDAALLDGPEGHARALRLAPELARAAGLDPVPTTDEIRSWIGHGQADPPATGRWWTVDPIDGTKGYVGGGQYAVALALMQDGRPLMGLLACPVLPLEALLGEAMIPAGGGGSGEDLRDREGGAPAGGGRTGGSLLLGLAGRGAWARDLDADDAPWHPIRVLPDGEPQGLPWCESLASAHSDQAAAARVAERLGLASPPLRLDSQVKYALMAAGRAACCLRIPRAAYVEKVWDHAAGACLLEAAGGRVSDLSGRDFDYSQGRGLAANRGMLLSSGPWHERLVAAVAAELGA